MLNWLYLFVQEVLQHQDFSKFQIIKPRLLEVVDKMLAEDISRLMAQIPHEETAASSEPLIKGMLIHCLYLNTTLVCYILLSFFITILLKFSYFCSLSFFNVYEVYEAGCNSYSIGVLCNISGLYVICNRLYCKMSENALPNLLIV